MNPTKVFNWVMVAALVAIVIIAANRLPHDSTDPEGGRSGLSLYTDHLTGCQYLRVGFFSTLVPRVGIDTTHMCSDSEERHKNHHDNQHAEWDAIVEKEAEKLR